MEIMTVEQALEKYTEAVAQAAALRALARFSNDRHAADEMVVLARDTLLSAINYEKQKARADAAGEILDTLRQELRRGR